MSRSAVSFSRSPLKQKANNKRTPPSVPLKFRPLVERIKRVKKQTLVASVPYGDGVATPP